MILQTERLILKELNINDMESLHQILKDPIVMKAYEHTYSDEEIMALFNRQLLSYKEHGIGLWAVVLKQSGQMAGLCGLTYQNINGGALLEIGYLFQKAHWRQGYALEAANGCKKYAFETFGATKVYSIIRDNNFASMNVAIRNGMLVRGSCIKEYYGFIMPHLIFCITKEEYANEMFLPIHRD